MPEHRQGPLNLNGAADDLRRRFIEDVQRNAYNRTILERLPSLDLPDAWLVAGCLFQTVWNLQCGRPPEAGIRDYDLFYFDGSDLSAAAEHAVADRVQRCFSDLPIVLEAKNQARVHTWYEDYFGAPYAPSRRSRDGIDRFLVDCTCVGLQPGIEGPVLYATFGLQALYAGELRPNPNCHQPALYVRKATDYVARWSGLTMLDTFAPASQTPI